MINHPVTQKLKYTNPPMTERERAARFDAIVQIGCIVCRLHHKVYSHPVIHHLCGLNSTRKGFGGKADDRETIGLCQPHHQYGGIGVSYHDGPKTWEKKYGSQQDLLALTNGYIEKQIRFPR